MGSEINLHGEIRSHPLSPPAGSGFCNCLYCGSTWGSQTRTPLCEAVKGNKGMSPWPQGLMAMESLTQVGQHKGGGMREFTGKLSHFAVV